MVNKFLLERDELILEMHIRQTGFTYRAWGPFTKSKEGIWKFKKNQKI